MLSDLEILTGILMKASQKLWRERGRSTCICIFCAITVIGPQRKCSIYKEVPKQRTVVSFEPLKP